MSDIISPEQSKAIRIEKMGKDLGLLYDSLYNEIIWIELKWIEFKELFGTKESRVDLMNKTAPFFFHMIQNVLWENLLLGIARITDPKATSGKKNITINALSEHITDLEFKSTLDNLINEIIIESDFCRDWRNRHISHNDFKLSIDNQNAVPLKLASRLKLKTVIQKVDELVHLFEFKYFNSQTGFQYMKSDRGALNLLHLIENGLRYNALQREKRKLGESLDDNNLSLV